MIDALSLSKNVIQAQPTLSETKAGRDFEAVLLTGFIENMLPENMGGTEAPQPGANVWRSFMAEAVAEQLARQSVTGVGNLIANQLMHVRVNLASEGQSDAA